MWTILSILCVICIAEGYQDANGKVVNENVLIKHMYVY